MIISIILFLTYLISATVLINRYVFGTFLKKIKQVKEIEFFPTVCVIIPCFNEGSAIYDTIISIVQSHYPQELLSVIVMDDCSTDNSFEYARKAAQQYANVTVNRNSKNSGKRKSISSAVKLTDAEIIVSVDSDVLVDSNAIRRLMSYFHNPEIVAVGGKVKVWNADDNWLSRMQTVKYFFGYEYLKSLENHQQQVMCLSGCLTAYRKYVLIELDDIIQNRNILGVTIKYGEDRFLTRHIVKSGYKTVINLKAFCYTKVPTTIFGYFKQQLRWRRSNFVDFLCGITHPHKLKPLVAINYYGIFGIQILYPFIMLQLFFTFNIFQAILLHLAILLLLSLIYLWDTRKQDTKYKVNPIWFLSMAFVMPITYILLSIIALFTLDSSSWETRS